MFEIDENNLPFVRTRQALLVLDLQNEFLAPGCQLPVDQPRGFLDNIVKLLPEFRTSGNVIWIRSIFEASRSVNEAGHNGEKIVTDNELPRKSPPTTAVQAPKLRPSDKILERLNEMAAAIGDDAEFVTKASETARGMDVDEEAFLTLPDGTSPRFVLPHSPAANIASAVISGYDSGRDIITQKSHYSAFKDGTLVQTLRSRFVTELYICGALTNISVYATAMDAAQYGYAITIVDDCLGYRSKPRHDEALRRLVDFTGCDITNSREIVQDLRAKARMAQRAPAPKPRPQTFKQREKKVREPELESMMSKLNLRPEAASSRSRSETPSTDIVADLPKRPVTERTRSTESLSSDSPELDLPPIPSRRNAPPADTKRVKTKIKTRRRASKSSSRQPALSKSDSPKPDNSKPSTPSTVEAATSASRKMPKPDSEEKSHSEDISTPASPVKTILKQATSPEVKTENAGKLDARDSESPVILDVPESAVNEAGSKTSRSDSNVICEGDTTIIYNLLDAEAAEGIFERIRDEVRWQKMSHQGGDVPRLVAVQGIVNDDGSIPIYRHPADESPPLLPFSPTVSLIKTQAEKQLGHPLNHVLIQFYRDGSDYISEHSDKTLDIVPNTFIVNVSLGAQRTMVFRTKRQQNNGSLSEKPGQVPQRQATRAPLPHNSMCKVGLKTNMRWLHAIRQDKRLPVEKSDAELAYNGQRISLTFRQIGTFLSQDHDRIWGQGATSKSKDTAKKVVNGNTPEAEKMIRAFGKENHSSEFDWEGFYGEGFDVLHIDNSRKLFLSGDPTADLRVKICLAHLEIECAEEKLSPSFNWKDGSSRGDAPVVPEKLPVRFVDNDLSRSTVTGDLAILCYLDSVYNVTSTPQPELARRFTRLQQAGDLITKWIAKPFSIKPFKRELEVWDTYANENDYITSNDISIVDWLLFPVLNEIYLEWKFVGLENLEAYYKRMRGNDSVIAVLGKVEEIEKRDAQANE